MSCNHLNNCLNDYMRIKGGVMNCPIFRAFGRKDNWVKYQV